MMLPLSHRASEEGGAEDGTAGFGLHLLGPLLSVLAIHECVRLQEPQFSTGLHAARQIPAGPPLSPCQYLPGKSRGLDSASERGTFICRVLTAGKTQHLGREVTQGGFPQFLPLPCHCGSSQEVWVSMRPLPGLGKTLPASSPV